MSHACRAFAAPSELAGTSRACRRYTANSSTPDAAKVTGGTHRRFRDQPGGRPGSRSSSHLAGTARRAAEMIVPVMGWDASLGVARECLECAGSRTWHSVVAVTIAAGVAHGEDAASVSGHRRLRQGVVLLMAAKETVYTHGHHESVLRSHRWRTAENSAAHLLPYLQPGMTVLDVGCGPGTITADLAALIAPGRLTASEVTADALALAQAEAASRGQGNIDFVVSDVHALEFPAGAFDVVHAHQVLQHVGDPVQALREMRRVCKPGGLVAVRDSDYRGFTWFPEIPAFDEWMRLYQEAALANGGEPQAGRRLLSWARAAGFTDITPSSSTWCFANPQDRQYWGGMWTDRVLQSALTTQLLDSGMATAPELQAISEPFHSWTGDEDGWFSILHGEILARA